VSSHASHHKPLVNENEQAEVVHLVPFASPVLQCYDEAGTDVAGIEEVVGVMIDNNKRRESWVSKKEPV
jgi:hypothetical protein